MNMKYGKELPFGNREYIPEDPLDGSTGGKFIWPDTCLICYETHTTAGCGCNRLIPECKHGFKDNPEDCYECNKLKGGGAL